MIETPKYVTDGVGRLDELISSHIYGVKEVTRYGSTYLPSDYFATTNSGMVHDLPGAPFTMRAYSWADCSGWEEYDGEYCSNPKCRACEPNFSHPASGLELRWYKHSERGEECNRDVSYEEWRKIERECGDWILAQDQKEPY